MSKQDELRTVVEEALGDLDDEDVAHLTATLEASLAQMRALRESTAHVHEMKHVGKDFTCHDCHRELVSDRGEERILVCPTVHGARGDLRPSKADGAVECGRVA